MVDIDSYVQPGGGKPTVGFGWFVHVDPQPQVSPQNSPALTQPHPVQLLHRLEQVTFFVELSTTGASDAGMLGPV